MWLTFQQTWFSSLYFHHFTHSLTIEEDETGWKKDHHHDDESDEQRKDFDMYRLTVSYKLWERSILIFFLLLFIFSWSSKTKQLFKLMKGTYFCIHSHHLQSSSLLSFFLPFPFFSHHYDSPFIRNGETTVKKLCYLKNLAT